MKIKRTVASGAKHRLYKYYLRVGIGAMYKMKCYLSSGSGA